MERRRFEAIVAESLSQLPPEFQDRLENIAIVVEDWPSREQLLSAGCRHRASLLGLYEGVPLTERGRGYGMVPPDKITLFQKPIEARCKSDEQIRAEVRRVVLHEIAHHFGIGDAVLEEIEEQKYG